jgi:Zeta toxin
MSPPPPPPPPAPLPSSRSMFPAVENATHVEAWPPQNEQISGWYDWTQSTVQMYKALAATAASSAENKKNDDNNNDESGGLLLVVPAPFQRERQKLDYTYHSRLIYSRLVFQDSILDQIRNGVANNKTITTTNNSTSNINDADRTRRQQRQRPWLIFTAGPMGVGKGYVLAQLKQMKVLDASDYLWIDPDMIKTTLPEMAGYDITMAATLLHAESAIMADVLFEHALSYSYDTMVDGSLRNVSYYQQLLSRIRHDYAHYRIAIIHVTAAPETIRRRALLRSGRTVPTALVDESIRQVPNSVQALTPLVDAVHVIRNDDNDDDSSGTRRRRRRLQLEKSVLLIRQREDVTGKMSIPAATMVEIKNPSWETFARSWQEESHLSREEDEEENENEPERHPPPIDVAMDDTFDCPDLHQIAAAIWQKSYPNFCPRCTICTDRQCGICRHGRHRCACQQCGVKINE